MCVNHIIVDASWRCQWEFLKMMQVLCYQAVSIAFPLSYDTKSDRATPYAAPSFHHFKTAGIWTLIDAIDKKVNPLADYIQLTTGKVKVLDQFYICHLFTYTYRFVLYAPKGKVKLSSGESAPANPIYGFLSSSGQFSMSGYKEVWNRVLSWKMTWRSKWFCTYPPHPP